MRCQNSSVKRSTSWAGKSAATFWRTASFASAWRRTRRDLGVEVPQVRRAELLEARRLEALVGDGGVAVELLRVREVLRGDGS
jgi:hypothetical protein